jgi:gas vesicle protein GvpL/GvpF
VSALYLYAVLAAPPRATALRGIGDAPVRALRVGDLVAAVADVTTAPPVTAAALRTHDDVVRALAAGAAAILPARFGSVVDDERTLSDLLTAQASALADALVLVDGCEQMTARVFGPAAAVATHAAPAPAATGTEYLEMRRRAVERASQVGEAAVLRARLDGLVRAERAYRHDVPPLIASLYHLVARGRAAEYRAIVDEAAEALAPARVTTTGPWPPYAFAPEPLG